MERQSSLDPLASESLSTKPPFFSYRLKMEQVFTVVDADLLKRCGFPQERWHELGLTLGLHKNTLDAIRRDKDTADDCLTECLSQWLSRADVDSKGEATFDSLSLALKSMNENAAADKLVDKIKEESCTFDSLSDAHKDTAAVERLDLEYFSDGAPHQPQYLPKTPAVTTVPMPVTPEVVSIAEKMKTEAEKKLKTSFTSYTPLSYIREGEIDYCIRVQVDNNELIDVSGKYAAGAVMRVNVKPVTIKAGD